jgi:hypothetical protein
MSSIMKVAVPAAACVLALLAAPAQATLIGDTVSVEYHFPDLGTIFESHLTVVQSGAADTVTFTTVGTVGNVNVEDSSVEIEWAPVQFLAASFNGVVITDMDFFGPPTEIMGLNIVTDLPGWNDSRASFTADSIALNFENLVAFDGFSMSANLLLKTAPEPASMGLFALGIAGVVLRARRNPR